MSRTCNVDDDLRRTSVRSQHAVDIHTIIIREQQGTEDLLSFLFTNQAAEKERSLVHRTCDRRIKSTVEDKAVVSLLKIHGSRH